MEQNTNEDIEIDLLELFQAVKQKLWIVILSGIVFATIAGLVSSFVLKPVYKSKSTLYILTKSTTLASLADLQIGTQLTQDYMILVKSRPVVEAVIEDVGIDMKYEALLSCLTVSNPSNTRYLDISISYSDPYLAKQIVDSFARISSERIVQIMASEKPTLVEEGYMNPTPIGPNSKKNIMIGGILGALLAGGIVVLLYILDDTIKDADDVSRYLGLTTLGLIPIEEDGAKQVVIDKKKRKSAKLKGKK